MRPGNQKRVQLSPRYKQQVIRLCFDPVSINKFEPGLKLLFSYDEPPMFVRVQRPIEKYDNNTVVAI